MKVTIDKDKCCLCQTCIIECSGYAFRESTDEYIVWFEEDCIDCMACTEPDFCPSGAITVEE